MKKIVLFKGKKVGMVHTMSINTDHIRRLLFPKRLEEKLQYLGAVWIPYKAGTREYKVIKDFLLFCDAQMRPKYVPRLVSKRIIAVNILLSTPCFFSA